MELPSPDNIKASTEKTVSFIQWLAELCRSKNWVTLLALLLVIVSLLNEATVKQFWPNISETQLPDYYTLVWFSVLVLIFLLALLIAIRTLPRKTPGPAADFSKRSAIKGLLPFRFEDAELFGRLQREQKLSECVEAITDRDFVFGVLSGESGSGKSSFLQAGLWPRLEQQPVPHRCVYVKFTHLDPLDSLRQALSEQLNLSQEQLQGTTLLALLEAAVQVETKTIVLVFDQFEQFFVHRKLREERESFIQQMADWYQRQPRLPVKILVFLRSDFSDRLGEFQKAMKYSLGPQQSFRLEKFEPQEATAVFGVIAEMEGIAFDERFVEEIVTQELASREDGLVSPVDVQVMAWMISGQKTAEERAFNRHAYHKLGGAEGLMERFLGDALKARVLEVQRQAAIKILVALTDLERNVRAGVLTIDDLQKKLAETIAADELEEAVTWLAGAGVRLITPSQLGGTIGYELAHERLIPAVRRLAGKQLSRADQANHLLDRRVNEWLGNNRAARYLFSWRDLRLIKKQKPYLVWGAQRKQKEALLIESHRRVRRHTGGASLILLLFACGAMWWYSPWGQIWQVQRDLVKLSQKIDAARALQEIVKVFMAIGDIEAAQQTVARIHDPKEKFEALAVVANAAGTLVDSEQVAAVLTQVVEVAAKSENPFRQAQILGVVAKAAESLEDPEQGAVLKQITADLMRVVEATAKIENPSTQHNTLGAVAKAAWTFEDPEQAAVLKQVILAARKIGKSSSQANTLGVVARVAQKLGDPEQAAVLKQITAALMQVVEATAKIEKSSQQRITFDAISNAAWSLGDSEQTAAVLKNVVQAAAKIKTSRDQAGSMRTVAEVAGALSDPEQTAAVLTQVVEVAAKSENPFRQAQILGVVAKAAESLEDPEQGAVLKQITAALMQVVETAAKSENSSMQVDTFRAVAKAAGTLRAPEQAAAVLTQVVEAAAKSENSSTQAKTFRAVAKVAGTIKAPEQVADLLIQVIQAATEVEDSFSQGAILDVVAEAAATLGAPEVAAGILKQVTVAMAKNKNPHAKADTLDAIAKAAGTLGGSEQVAELLTQVMAAAKIEGIPTQASILGAVAKAAGTLRAPDLAAVILKQVLREADQIHHPKAKFDSLGDLARAAGTLGGSEQAEILERVGAILKQEVLAAASIGNSPTQASILGAVAKGAESLKAPEAAAVLTNVVKAAAKIKTSRDQAHSLRAVTNATGTLGAPDQAAILLTQVVLAAMEMAVSPDQVYSLGAVANVAGTLGDPEQSAVLKQTTVALKQVLAAAKIQKPFAKADTLVAIANATKSLGSSEQVALLTQVVQVGWKSHEYFHLGQGKTLDAIVEVVGTLGEPQQVTVLKQMVKVATEMKESNVKVKALGKVVKAAGTLGGAEQVADLLLQVMAAAMEMEESAGKAATLTIVARGAERLADPEQAAAVMKQVMAMAAEIKGASYGINNLHAFGKAAAKLGYWRQARGFAKGAGSDVGEAKVLVSILQVWAEDENSENEMVSQK